MVPALSMCSDGTLLGFVYCNEQFFLVDFVYNGLRHYDMYVLNFLNFLNFLKLSFERVEKICELQANGNDVINSFLGNAL